MLAPVIKEQTRLMSQSTHIIMINYDYDSMIIIWSHEVETNATILILTYCTNII